MQCRDIERDLDSFLDGELAPPECAEIEAHLRDCTPCQQLCEDQLGMKLSLRAALRPPEPPATLRDFVHHSLHGQIVAADRTAMWQRLRRPLVMGVAARRSHQPPGRS